MLGNIKYILHFDWTVSVSVCMYIYTYNSGIVKVSIFCSNFTHNKSYVNYINHVAKNEQIRENISEHGSSDIPKTSNINI